VSQDWHKALESMPDEEYVPEEINLGLERSNPAWAREILAWPGRNSALMAALPEYLNLAQPGLSEGGLGRNPGQTRSS
jgi:hypothetical protein